MSIEEDLDILEQQERLLQFTTCNAEDVWQLGTTLRDLLLTQPVGGSIEIEVAGVVLFRTVTVGANPGQANWIRRKRNTVHHFARCTYAVGRRLEREGATLEQRHGLSEIDFAAHGGGFPVVLQGTGMVGSVVLSGLPQRDDHNMVIEALSRYLRVNAPRLPS